MGFFPASPHCHLHSFGNRVRATRRTTELSRTRRRALTRDGPAIISLHAEAAFPACPLRSGSAPPRGPRSGRRDRSEAADLGWHP
jgi:hypothetical protein